MSAFAVRPDELFALGRELTSSSAQLRDAVDTYDNGFAAIGEQLAHPVALSAYENFFGAWSLRLHQVAEALDASAETVRQAGERYAQWERFVEGLTR
ncbi:MAG: hypothetical protein KY451_06295 [Actinobacteria bacterium]|nr:hypothetical protein [Actinomycetota bacterium]MBW3646586.1 hypothetical protein [Actinomycetota bacterium]